MTEELRKCSRCFQVGTSCHFEKNNKGDWYKQCNNCRQGCREEQRRYKEVNKDKLKQKKLQEKQRKEIKKNAMDEEQLSSKMRGLESKATLLTEPLFKQTHQQYMFPEIALLDNKRACRICVKGLPPEETRNVCQTCATTCIFNALSEDVVM